MSKVKIDTILFDFFDVIHADHQKAWLRKHGYERDGEFAAASDDLDKGLINIHEYFERYAAAHKDEITPQELKEVYEDLSVVDIGVIELIIELREQGYKIGLISNSSGDELRPILEKNDLFGLFDEVVISGEVGVAKPEPEIFYIILKYLKVKPEHAFFTDDNQHNIESASAIGITARLFTSADKLRADLIELGLLAK